MGIRLVVIDDNPHLTWEGRVHPVNATFHRFLAAILDVEGAPVASIVHVVPLRAADAPPATLALDPRIEVVGSAPFDGIEGYLRHLPAMLRANRPVLRRAITGADLVWLKVPASNAGLAAAIAMLAGMPRFGYVAGSAADVAAGQAQGGMRGAVARVVGYGYDAVGWLASIGGDRVVVGHDLEGAGIVTSLVGPNQVRDREGDPWPAIPWRLRLAWAGRLASGKGLEALLDALALLAAAEAPGDRVELVILGDGPARVTLESRAVRLGVADRIHWLGHVAQRTTYMDALASCDLFVFPSPAEGFPKVVLDAMAVGLPVVARQTGSLAQLGPDRLEHIAADDAPAICEAVRGLVAAPGRATGLRGAGRAFAAAHTRPAEAARLVERWEARWPGLPWESPSG